MLQRIGTYFTAIPDAIAIRNFRYYLVGHMAYHFAVTVHAFWAILFGVLGVGPLFIFNLFSVAIFIFCIATNRRGYHLLPTVLAMCEIVAHQVLACYLLGPGSGFQLYLLVVSLYPFIMPAWSKWIKLSIFAMPLAGFICIELLFKGTAAVAVLEGGWLTILNISNVFFSFVCLGILGNYLSYAVYKTEEKLDAEFAKSERLLLNILPASIAAELKEKGAAEARDFDEATILFTDFKDFTRHSETLSAHDLVDEINACFKAFDEIISRHGIEKIKTIGDSYMAVGGVPEPGQGSPVDVIHAALEMQAFMQAREREREVLSKPAFQMRAGIHTGPVVAGIVGVKKFAYDIWGDTVNMASRMESHGEVGRVNISQHTHRMVRDAPGLAFVSRGMLPIKGKGEVEMYFVQRAT